MEIGISRREAIHESIEATELDKMLDLKEIYRRSEQRNRHQVESQTRALVRSEKIGRRDSDRQSEMACLASTRENAGKQAHAI